MSNRFTVDVEQLEQAAIRLHALAAFLDSQLDELDNRVTELGAGWSGLAATAFAASHTAWSPGARELATSLRAQSALIEQAGQRYLAAHQANNRMIQKG
ncbi:WXG100 family type VII secretion target [Nocardia asteroides]|uniref:WXG100 family type VII secretion target n=1 Tax=Nocardia asteroides TaxID=1824 RepID=UPI001E5623E8|nr:WXG100 family type VII secretion target [Nocardia asteroides]UGT62247.1 WXG100 family type VII secretion target [Nocardia asteroides]